MKSYFSNVFRRFLYLNALTVFISATSVSNVIAASADVSVDDVKLAAAELSSEETAKRLAALAQLQ